ncbi:hypothetical protein ORV05_33715 [Amycolatopsis cynarae]|uniref:PPE domain-containing protein n=1 Tax=Amycolatopsis cynarae TaxID=2995223 RepID=A0ABY7B1C7_9PSEU|nr:hypothetical protein [Amycolatopsis sp. HUAS 11-8]WAL65765.1 hypothetical protein ORV05_33715 [Amycolatopsis sp. HUAS 11-8]
MITFDSSRYDITTLIEKLRDQRFDGYDPESLAQEVEKFRGGSGTASMGNAVAALKKVAIALGETDTTLRRQLAALGVEWQSKAGGQAGSVLAGQAGFSSEANQKVTQAAELIFQQGEAFNRTRNKLPDPEALRQGADGFSASDGLFSLFGFETDHAKAVKANLEANAQAVDALNAYAHDTGDYLASSQPVAAPPETMDLAAPGSAAAAVADPPITPVPPAPQVPSVPSGPDTAPTQAASAPVTPVRTAPVHVPPVSAPAASVVHDAPTPPDVVAVAGRAGADTSTAPQHVTLPSSAPAPTDETSTTSGTNTGYGRSNAYDGSRSTSGPTQTVTGEPLGGGPGGTSGLVDGRTATGAGPEGGRSGAWGQSGGNAAWGQQPGGGANSGQNSGQPGGGAGDGLHRTGGGAEGLAKGKVVGSAPVNPTSTGLGPGFTATRAAGGVGGLAEAVPAIGAAGAGGVVGGENERQGGRGRGRQGDQAGKRVRQLPVGDLPEEAEAERVRKAAPAPPSRERTRAILEPAATQDGEEDAAHVRRYGIDDKDLFTDPREVSPDLIGDKELPEDR